MGLPATAPMEFAHMDDEEYQREYDKAAAELDAAEKSTTARGPDGKFTKAEEPAEEPAKVEEPKQEEPKEDEPADEPKQEDEDDKISALQKRLDAAEKALKDTQAWGTKLAQERAAEKREAERRAREASKPPILDANPELADAIRHITSEPKETQQDPQALWVSVVERAHPGVFSTTLDPGLEKALADRLTALSEDERNDPLIAIREITAGKLEFAERQAVKKRAAEEAKQKEKAAMSVPGAGASGSRSAPDPDADANRIRNMSPAEFEKERRRVLGY